MAFELTWHKLLVDLGIIFPVIAISLSALWFHFKKGRLEDFIFLIFMCNILISFTNPYFLNFDVLFLTFFCSAVLPPEIKEAFIHDSNLPNL